MCVGFFFCLRLFFHAAFVEECVSQEVTTAEPERLWTDGEMCGQDISDSDCRRDDVPHNKVFNISCYDAGIDARDPQYRACLPVCASQDLADQSLCNFSCQGEHATC